MGFFEVDTTEIINVCQENGFNVLEVLNPIGEIEPGTAVPLLIRFHPIEAKAYKVINNL